MTAIAPTDIAHVAHVAHVAAPPMPFWTAPNLSRLTGVRHGFTCRAGGVSDAPFDTLNLGLHVGDDPAKVIENRRRAASALGVDLSRIVCAAQVHGAGVAVAAGTDAGRGATDCADALPDADALLTDTPGLLLALFFADCVPVFFAGMGASGQPVVGIAHAGWRGMAAGVLEAAVRAMEVRFGVLPDTLHVAIGPHIGPDHFEVGEEVAGQFPGSVVSRHPVTARPHIHLAESARLRLASAGIAAAHLHTDEECTVSRLDRYFSHRRDQGRTGRMAALIGIAE